MLLGREKVVRELPPHGDLRPEQDAPVELAGAVGAGCRSRVPTLLRRTLDPFTFACPATGQQQSDRANDDDEDADSMGCGFRARQTPDLPVQASVRNTGPCDSLRAAGQLDSRFNTVSPAHTNLQRRGCFRRTRREYVVSAEHRAATSAR